MGKSPLTKRQKEELKKKEEEKKTAEVFNEFVATFDGESTVGKTFIRGDVINPEKLGKSVDNQIYIIFITIKILIIG